MARHFIDTNIVVYANDGRYPTKQERALEVVKHLMLAGTGVVSIQVLQEYANTALTKLEQGAAVVIRQLKLLEKLIVVSPSPALVRRAVEIRNTYQTTFWDASIIAAAEAGECDAVLSEDLNTGQYYAGIRVINPFAADHDPSAGPSPKP